ncbi:hypothetical protein RND81_10G079100 [Saponaria officinalis]|uniref:Uncharacterized protein n=1 Tax=Saponaria officinalis TaxID=3572 RepID=A0AAW1I1M6_SAPOF
MKKKQEKNRSFSEIVLELVASTDEVASLAKDSENESDILNSFAVYIEKLSQILETVRKDNMIMDTPRIRSAMCSLEAEVARARDCISKTSTNFRVNVEKITHDLGRSLGLFLFASLGVSLELKQQMGVLQKEMMNAKFHDFSSCSYSSECGEIQEVYDDDNDDDNGICIGLEEIEEEEEVLSWGDTEDIALQLKYGNDEEFVASLKGLDTLIRDRVVDFEWVIDEGIIQILFNRLGSSKCVDRLGIIKALRSISLQYEQTKEKMTDINSLTTLVKSLAREEKEQREAVGLLMELSHIPSVRRRIGRIQGCIIMLVTILNGSDSLASRDAEKLLSVLSSNTQNALLMSEAGYFQPLIQHLREGSEMSKILMATALSRMVLTVKSRAILGENGAIEPLVAMFKTGKLEAKLSALNALQNLSLTPRNIFHILDSGLLPPLLQSLFSVTSSLMTLREPASSILAVIAQSESILENKDLPNHLLSLLNLSTPKIKYNILLALNRMVSHAGASFVSEEINRNGGFQLVLPFIKETDTKIRTTALNLLYTLSRNFTSEDFAEILSEKYLPTIVGLISSSSNDTEKAASVGLLSNIPVSDKKATEILKKANILPILVSLMSASSSTMKSLDEYVAGIIIRFTVSSEKKLQLYSIDVGVVPILVKLLSNGSVDAKSKAAVSLTQLSQSFASRRRPRNSRWVCVPSPIESICDVHNRYCNVKGSFCLVKSGAFPSLIRVLVGEEREADVAALNAVSSLLENDLWENGSNFLAKNTGAVNAVIKILEEGTTEAKEKAMWILDRVFRIEDYRSEYGNAAQVVLIDIAQSGEPSLRPTVAKLLAQLGLLQEQSSYF